MTKTTRLCRCLLLAGALSACAADGNSYEASAGSFFPEVRADEREAILAMVNDASTSVHKLDIDVGLDTRAARGIVERRDETPFTNLGELTRVPWLGPVGLDNLVSWSMAEGWPNVEDPYVGTFDGVPFSYQEACATLDFVNDADPESLDAEIDVRAADAIAANRPFDSMEALAHTWYVGHATLRDLRDLGMSEHVR